MQARKPLSVLLALLFALTMLSGATITTAADEIVEVSTWTGLKAALQAGGNILLIADVKPDDAYWDDALTVPSGVTATLDLNGYIVDRGYRDDSTQIWDGSVIKIGGTLTLLDGDPTARHEPAVTYTDPVTERVMTVNGGILTGGHPDQYGGAVQVQGGTFNMEGGSIACNSVGKNAFGAEAALGGGVYMQSGTFNMSGGAIVGNKASNKNTMMPDTPLGKGGAVFIAGGTFTLSGGLIRGNCAGDYGGAVYVGTNGTFAMTGGIIVGNISNFYNNQVNNIDGGSAPNMVTSFLHSNDGNDYTLEQAFPSGADTTIATDVFVRDGYEFKGWALGANSNVALADGADFSASGDGELWAQWERLTYAVTIGAGENMTYTSGDESQSVPQGEAMTAVVYTADEGYFFPEDYETTPVNGVGVTRDSFTQITVSGTPTANTTFYPADPTAKTKLPTPNVTYVGTAGGDLTVSGLEEGATYRIGYPDGSTAEFTVTGSVLTLPDAVEGTYTIVQVADGDLTGPYFDSDTVDMIVEADVSEEPSEPSEEPSEPSKEPSEPSEEPALLGDANGDGSVDMKDVLLIRKFIANMGAAIDETAADVNRDGSVDMKDVLLIRKFIARLIDRLG